MAPQSRAMIAALSVGKNAMKASKEFSGLASDSRAVRPGYLFAALSGTRADGANFVDDAIARGAVAVIGRPELRARVETQGARFIAADNPRLALAKEASAFFDAQPKTVAAVTGTNGKTSVAVFLRQIWSALGKNAASLGTIGAVTPKGEIGLKQTTPDPIELHRLLAEMKAEGVDCLALEASSHGLDQYRLDGVDITAAAFTNLTHDHLDYHPSVEDYLQAKLRLFSQVVRPDGIAVVNADDDWASEFDKAANERGLRLIRVGENAGDVDSIELHDLKPHANHQTFKVACSIGGIVEVHAVHLPLVGTFQVSNALVAAGLAIGLGGHAPLVFSALERLKGAPGRLELVASKNDAPIYVDYAHTPDALENVLRSIRPHVTGRLRLVFGCGGDRDKSKRPLMGAIADEFADDVTVTDDNPRGENPARIRGEIRAKCQRAANTPDRSVAIHAAIQSLQQGDVLVIAGKGHETGQIVGSETRPFSDKDEAVKAALSLGGRAA